MRPGPMRLQNEEKKMEFLDLSGEWSCKIPGRTAKIRLPGTLEENGIGDPDNPKRQWHLGDVGSAGIWQEGDPILTRLTRSFCYEGPAEISRALDWTVPPCRRIFLECERARHLSLKVNGEMIPCMGEPNISTPYVFEVTGRMTGHDMVTLISDNSYPGWPHEAIVRSSAAADETQTNWNGILGYLRLRMEKPVFIEHVAVYPKGETVDILLEINAASSWKGTISVASCAFLEKEVYERAVDKGCSEIRLKEIRLKKNLSRWDIGEGKLYELTVSADGMDSRIVSFGIREFYAKDGSFFLNGRRIFLRSETNCAVFPETGYSPMSVEEWREILKTYRDYGVNCVRFHSHCPPEAAFTAADEMGMLMQPELSHWNPKNTFSTPDTCTYYAGELKQILRLLSDHPSFVMLTLGNELRRDAAGAAYMTLLLEKARMQDPTRLYANGSNTEYGLQGQDEASDFYTAMAWFDKDLRATSGNLSGWLNHSRPDSQKDYTKTLRAIEETTQQPVFSFEVGQYEVLPDFDEISCFHGITRPDNLRFVRRKVEERGLLPEWKDRVEASGELSLLCYRAEVEAALRTEKMAGISLLGLQDFPGQGAALVGMLNSHLKRKPFDFARSERFRSFFADVVPLVCLPGYTFFSSELLTAKVLLANYGRKDIRELPQWSLRGDQMEMEGAFPMVTARMGGLTQLGRLEIPLESWKEPSQLTLSIQFGNYKNEYSVWVYPDEEPKCPGNVYECRSWDEKALRVLDQGGAVYLAPDAVKEAMPNSVQAQFSTNFWSVCSFIEQPGCMGQYVQKEHPLFKRFPTQKHTDWQWWQMAVQRAWILPKRIEALVEEMDTWAYLRPMAQLFEARCLNGKVLASSMGLHNLQQYPEARALQSAVYAYMASEDFRPSQELSPKWMESLFQTHE